jgi:hypothetical protein
MIKFSDGCVDETMSPVCSKSSQQVRQDLNPPHALWHGLHTEASRAGRFQFDF